MRERSMAITGVHDEVSKDFVPPVIPKDPADYEKLDKYLCNAFPCNQVVGEPKETLILAFNCESYKAGDVVIREGEKGDKLYIVKEGTFHVIKKVDGEDVLVSVLEAGETFGELGMLYNAPRASTVIAVTDGQCWTLDQPSYLHIVQSHAIKKRNAHLELLESIAFLKPLGRDRMIQLADIVKEETHPKGSYIIRQGEIGRKFYILIKGTAQAIHNDKDVVLEYQKNDYFGELSLITKERRKVSVVATSDCTVLVLDAPGFNRLMGPLSGFHHNLKKNYKRLPTSE